MVLELVWVSLLIDVDMDAAEQATARLRGDVPLWRKISAILVGGGGAYSRT